MFEEEGKRRKLGEVCSTKNTINVNYRQVGGTADMVRGNNPHSIVRVRVVSKHGEQMDKSALVRLVVKIE